ncbi:tyrosine-protein phosphatase [Cryobacterium sp. SO2]|uniref:tyrosine-protein phosphatase n=1 Tax=Cryobacterium sp. SO2 TaxID=1897060 RepID=UPI00223CD65F|nr:tyrosine-protein phosphatase [Cryobacterium sp. SO2]WEO76276.1 tyrosine-protein phosphatase [Cryobacterium sp. SO2]
MNNPAAESATGSATERPAEHTREREQPYAHLVADRGRELAGAVAVLAEGEGPLVVHGPGGEHATGLVLALALLAAGLPHEEAVAAALPAEPQPEALLGALAAIAARGGPEPYLLRHGLTVSHFLALRERFAGDDAGLAAGDVS